MADDFRTGGAAGLARQQDLEPKRFEPQRQHGGLGRLAGPLPALKGDEFTSHLRRASKANWSSSTTNFSCPINGLQQFAQIRSKYPLGVGHLRESAPVVGI